MIEQRCIGVDSDSDVIDRLLIYRVAQKKTSRTVRNYNGTYTLWGEIFFGIFVDQYVLLLTYKCQWDH